MRILFMGTPDIAASSLNALVQAGHDICGVFTQADKPVGRGHKLAFSPVKTTAMENDIPVFQPASMKSQEALDIVRQLSPDIIVVVAFGKILPGSILNLPQYGSINLHVSLLPKYRGAAPIQWAVLNGDCKTGVSIMRMDEGLDTGDVLYTEPISIGENETSGELFERVSSLGAVTLCKCLARIAELEANAKPQAKEGASYACQITKEMAEVQFDRPSTEVHNWVRGMNPSPMAWFIFNGKRIKLSRTKCLADCNGPMGSIVSLNPLIVACANGSVELVQVIPEGKKAMAGKDWANGARLSIGQNLLQG